MAKDPETLRELRETLEANVDIMRIYEARAVRAEARLADAEAVCDAEKHMREGITPQDRWEAAREMDRVFKAYLAGKEKTDDRPRAEE